MAESGNFYDDLLEIAAGNLALASDRLKQFTTYANSVAGISDVAPVAESGHGREANAPAEHATRPLEPEGDLGHKD